MIGSSTFGSFTTARLGIYAAQKGLDVTGHNITNINTRGYTRQRLDQISLRVGGVDRYTSVYNKRIGAGTLITGISQLRDPYLDIRFRNEQASVGAMDAKLAGLEELATIMDEVCRGADNGGLLEGQFNDLVSQLEALTLQAGQNDFDTLVRTSADALVELFNSYAKKLEGIKEGQELSLKQDIDSVNTILKNLSELNSSIMKAEIRGDPALELRDERNLLLDDLSQFMKINVQYEPQNVGAGMVVQKLVVKLDGGSKATLVDGNYAGQLSIREEMLDSGVLGQSPNFNLDLSELTNARGETLAGSAVVQFGDNDLYGAIQATREILTEAGEFTPDSVINGGGGPPPVPPIDPQAATKRGIPYYQNALDSLAQKLASILNEANIGYLVDNSGNYLDANGDPVVYVDGTLGNVTLNKNTDFGTLDNEAAARALLDSTGVALGGPLFSNDSNGNDPTGITAKNISIAKDWDLGNVRIVNSFVRGISADGTAAPSSTANDNILHMVYLLDAKHQYMAADVVSSAVDGSTPFFKGSFQEFLANISINLANDTRTTATLLNNYYYSAEEIATSRDSVSGVDLNDEATSLMQYQKSYAAACRLLTTLDEALDKLINGTGVVGR